VGLIVLLARRERISGSASGDALPAASAGKPPSVVVAHVAPPLH